MSQPAQPYSGAEAIPVGNPGARVDIQERKAWAISGWFGVVIIAICIVAIYSLVHHPHGKLVAVPVIIGVIVLTSLVIVQPGQTRVVRFFGSYVGTVRHTGLSWILPFSDRRNVSIRVRNFETNHLKVNDADGNPVEIASIVVWQVADTSRALFAVDDYLNFVRVQAESALKETVAEVEVVTVATGEASGVNDRTAFEGNDIADVGEVPVSLTRNV
jgi:hypothetical protein